MLLMIAGAVPAPATERQPNADYRARREALAAKLDAGGVVLLFAAPEPELDKYRQNESFYYLTGWNEPGAALIIIPALTADSAPVKAGMAKPREYSEVFFLPARNARMEAFTGVKLGPDTPGAAQKTGFQRVAPIAKVFEELMAAMGGPFGYVYSDTADEAPSAAALRWMKSPMVMGRVQVKEVKPLIASLRMVKDAREIDFIRHATNTSVLAHMAAMKSMKAGQNERDVAAVIFSEFLKGGCERPAYPLIVGAGLNSTVLHYSEDDQPIADGDVVVLDDGCEYSMYATDITRTLPANGKFTARQREVYDIVYGAQQAAAAAFVAGKSSIGGASANSLQKVAMDYINSHGKDKHGDPLGKYFIHGLGHHVGLNVHDPSEPGRALDKGMVFTIEPGIYIPEEKIGVRIEDTFMVGDDGKLVNLSGALPSKSDEVEKMMASGKAPTGTAARAGKKK